MRAFGVVLALVVAVSAVSSSYIGFKVYRIHPTTENQIQLLTALGEDEHFDFWSLPRSVGKPVDVMVNPDTQETFVDLLNVSAIKYEVLIDNVDRVVQKERFLNLATPRVAKGKISHTAYHKHDVINAYLHELEKDYPDLVTLESIGKSYEGRDMIVAKISSDPSANKPVILIDGGIHAREWLAVATAVYILDQVVENKENRALLDKIDWYILPVLNPDGYDYTHLASSTRFWRKTRSPGSSCKGTDANRNFGYHWGEIGSSSYECSDTYHGAKAFSEVEAVNLRNFADKYKTNIKLYLTLHSYGEYVLYPWGFTVELPTDAAELQQLGDAVAKSIYNVAGTKYTVGSSSNALYPSAGGSDDWLKGGTGVELSYTIELPGGGSQGFDPPPTAILTHASEFFQGVKTYHSYTEKKFA